MEIQPLAPGPAINPGPQPPTVSVQPDQTATNIPPPQPPVNSVYPTPNAGFGVPVPAPLPPPANNYSSQSTNSYDTTGHKTGSHGILALILSGLAVVIIPLLIFAPSLLKSMTMAVVWLLIITVLSVAGLVLGLLSQKKSESVVLMSVVAIMVSTVMLILCLVIGSYYIKLQITLNAYKNKYNSRTNGSYPYDGGL